MNLYLSGPMTGLVSHNYPEFEKKAAALRRLGYEIDCPTEHFGGDRTLPRQTYLDADMAAIEAADGVVVMRDWQYSEGARQEIAHAMFHDKPLYCVQCLEIGEAESAAAACFDHQVGLEDRHVAEFGPRQTFAQVAARQGREVGRSEAMVLMAFPDDPGAKPPTEQDGDKLVHRSDQGDLVSTGPFGSVTLGGATTKATAEREQFDTGSQRGSRAGKGRFDLVPWRGIREVAGVCERGALIYGERNVEKGQKVGRLLDSGVRHVADYLEGKTDEEHLAQAAWNILWAIVFDKTRPELVDIPAQRAARGLDEEERAA